VKVSSLHEISEIRLLIKWESCFLIMGGWLDLALMYKGMSFAYVWTIFAALEVQAYIKEISAFQGAI